MNRVYKKTTVNDKSTGIDISEFNKLSTKNTGVDIQEFNKLKTNNTNNINEIINIISKNAGVIITILIIIIFIRRLNKY